jgi:nucleoside-diphosphate-sugar epimerase
MHILMTGATGLLGRNYLFENLNLHRHDLSRLNLTLLGCDQPDKSIRTRILELLFSDGWNYLSATGISKTQLADWTENHLTCLACQLDREDLGLQTEARTRLKNASFDQFVHIAACTDFRDSPQVQERLREVNFEGTRRLLNLCSALNVGQIVYVGTAYSCGEQASSVAPDLIKFDQAFRNPYEKIKLETECLVREFGAAHHIRTRIFRPSTISGRLLHPELGSVPKFDVFYAYGAFLAKIKSKLKSSEEKAGPVHVPLRVSIVPHFGLNIVPADYAAKVMAAVCRSDHPEDSYHLVNTQETPNSLYMGIIEKSLDVAGVEFVDAPPKDMNRFELLIYKTIFSILAPYCNAPPTHFDTTNLRPVLERSGLECPKVDAVGMGTLIEYARQRQFGLSV